MKDEERVRREQGLLALAGPEIGSTWTHYKGGRYRVLACSLDEETLAPLVTYQSLERGHIWTRKLSVWLEQVEVEGRTMPRFRREG